MDCPVCRDAMVVLELDEVEIDHCLSCGGIWLDRGELELLLEHSEARDAFLSSFQADEETRERARKCPICSRKMDKVLCGVGKKARVDRCRRNDGIWFDRGELSEITNMEGLRKDDRVLSLLKDMFSQKRR